MFINKLERLVKINRSLLCIGLDSDIAKIPFSLQRKSRPQSDFNKTIIDATHDLVCAYKPNSAFYEARGTAGIAELKTTCDYLKNNYPEIPIILDAKRADIGSTNGGYAEFAFEYLKADAITVHPYLGREALEPLLERRDKGIIVLCRTSNPGAGEFQDLKCAGGKLYQRVAEKVAKTWNTFGNCMLVVGATYPRELKAVRRIVGDMIILVPGIGAQGGDLEATLKYGLNSRRSGLIINASRSIIFADSGVSYAQTARVKAAELRSQINSYRRKPLLTNNQGETRLKRRKDI